MDLVIGVPLRFGIGYGLAQPATIPYVPTGRACFWGGWGGSIILMDLDRRLTISYMMNKIGSGTLGSSRTEAYVRATYAALGGNLDLNPTSPPALPAPPCH